MEALETYLGETLYAEVKNALAGKGKDGRDLLLAIANDGSFLPKAKFDALYKEYRELKDGAEKNSQRLAAFESMQEENSLLQQQLKETAEKTTSLEVKAEQEMAALRKEFAVEKTLSRWKAKNFKAVNALLDWEQVSYEDGSLQGLEEQLLTVKETAPYLFDGEERFAYAPKSSSSAGDFSAMSDAEYYRMTEQKG